MNVSNIRRTNYDVTYKATSLGLVMQVKPDLKLMTEPIKSGTTGAVTLGARVIALEGSVLVQVQEIDSAQILRMLPWAANGNNPLTPAEINKDLYDYAGLLTLHPRDKGNTDEDLNLVKAVPRQNYNLTRDGTKDDVWEIAFEFYPDRSKLLAATPTLVYGYVGPVPA